jgi:hypothetical protein
MSWEDIRSAACYYGLRDDPTFLKDQTAAFQDFLDDVRAGGMQGAGRAIIPPWRIMITTVRVRPGLDLEGCGIGPRFDSGRGTFIGQFPVEADAIINDPTRTFPGQWMHWTRLSNFRLERLDGGTAGSGIKYTTSTGEGTIIDRVFVQGFPHNGIWMADGATPMKMRDLHVFKNGQYGFKIGDSTGTKRVYASLIETISGDANGLGLVHLQRLQRDYSVLCFMHVKSEGVTSGSQDNTFVIEDCTAGIEIHTLSMLGIIPRTTMKSMVRIKGPLTPRVALHNYGCSGIDNTLVDEANGITIPYTSPKIATFYKDGLLSSWG